MSRSRVALLVAGVLVVAVGGWFAVAGRVSSTSASQTAGGVAIPADVQTATLQSPAGDPAVTGVATRQFVDVVFVHGISATLPDLPVGQFYAGWLTTAADTAHPLPTGKFTKDATGWTLNFSSPTNESRYDGVLVTVQTGEGQAPGTTVLTGSFH